MLCRCTGWTKCRAMQRWQLGTSPACRTPGGSRSLWTPQKLPPSDAGRRMIITVCMTFPAGLAIKHCQWALLRASRSGRSKQTCMRVTSCGRQHHLSCLRRSQRECLVVVVRDWNLRSGTSGWQALSITGFWACRMFNLTAGCFCCIARHLLRCAHYVPSLKHGSLSSPY